MAKWQTLPAWHRFPGHGFGQKSLPRRSLLKKAGCKDFILCGFVLWPAPCLSATARVPHCSVPHAAPSSLQASPMQERGLWLQVQADAGVSPAGCSPAAAEGPTECGQEAEHSYASSEGKEGRNLGWVRTEGIYQYREFFTYYLLSHTHPHARTRQPSIFLQAQKGHQSIIHPSGFPGSLKQMEVTFKRTPSCSTHRMLCPWVGAGQAPESPQERWDFRRFLRPALAPRWAPFIRPLNWPCIFARFLEGARSRSWVGAGTEHT